MCVCVFYMSFFCIFHRFLLFFFLVGRVITPYPVIFREYFSAIVKDRYVINQAFLNVAQLKCGDGKGTVNIYGTMVSLGHVETKP